MELMKERPTTDSPEYASDGKYYEETRGFALGDYWNLTSYDRPITPDRFKNRKQEERDRIQQKKLTELQTQTQRLERKIALLKTENETLKRKQDDKKPLEEKIKTLKKRNAELAAIARRLEEKAKHLQQENMKKAKEMAAGAQLASGVQSTDQMKKMFARQRAKDLSEHAKQMLAKDREIEDLRKKCQELADQLSNSDFIGPENSEMYGEKEELVSIIKLAAKERLQLESQLAVAKPGPFLYDCV
ncbi:associated protein 1 [Mactra antiquata]